MWITPDIEEFIETKAREEDKIRALRDAGFDMDLGGKDITSVQYQNANNSVRVTDEFMNAVEDGTDFALRSRTDNSVIERIDAADLFTKMAKAAWECADPGIQYDDTINDWHTNPRVRTDHRVQPVLGVHVAGQLLVQPGQPQPAEVPQRRRLLRCRDLRQGRGVHHHRDGHLHLLRRFPDRGHRPDHPRLPAARHRVRQPGGRC